MNAGLRSAWRLSAIFCAALFVSGCVTRPPTIAHVHLGHALTGVHVTPNKQGYLLVAERQADEVLALTERAKESKGLEQLKLDIAAAVTATSSDDHFGLKHSIILAANHISFAATSSDASLNVQQAAPIFARDIARVVERCELIGLLGKDVAAASSLQEAVVLSSEILQLARANVEGDDSNGDGQAGSAPNEFGMRQLRAELDGIIARENPPYRTVDEWFLFNLVRLPNGNWVFDKLGRGGNIEGYK
jgi:hypothetical protein